MNDFDEKNVKIVQRLREILDIQAEKVVKLLKLSGLRIATAESCTGGLLSELITSVSGASDVFETGICTYSDRIKHQVLGVPNSILDEYGAVSSQTAIEMAKGMKRFSGADLCVAVTGIAGPTGALPGKPVGTVYVAYSFRGREFAKLLELGKEENTDRNIIRLRTAVCVFENVEQLLMEDVQ